MSRDEPTNPPSGQPRVVKKVVKRTVVRPPGSSSAHTSSGRISRPPGASDGSTYTKKRDGATATASSTTPAKRPAINVGSIGTAGKRWTARGAQGASAGLGGLRRAGTATRGFVAGRYRAARAYRLPPQPPWRSVIVVGLLLGLLAVVAGWLSGILFSLTRGTSSGGGLWGGLVVVALAVFAVWAGARLLRSLAVENAGTISLLAVLLVLIAVLMFFLDLASGPWAWLVVPLVCASSYGAAFVLTRLATTVPEPTE